VATKVEVQSQPPGHAAVSDNIMSHLKNIDRALGESRTTAEQKQDFMQRARDALRQAFISESLRHAIRTSSEQEAFADEMMALFDAGGTKAFSASSIARRSPLPGPGLWAGPRMIYPLGTLLVVLVLTLTAMSMGAANQDLGKVEWRTEWLFTFPASARTIFLSQILEFALVNPLNWFIAFPFFGVVYVCAGYGWHALPLGLLMMLYTGVLAGSLRTVIETQLRTSFSMATVKNAQAFFTLTSLIMFFMLVGSVAAPWLMDMLYASALPPAAMYNPLSAPLLLCGEQAAMGGALLLVFTILIPLIAVQYSQWLVRDGLLSTSGVYTGTRTAVSAKSVSAERPAERTDKRQGLPWFLRGAARKDLLLLFRDRNFLVQTLFVPVLIVGFNLIMNPELLPNVLSNFRHAAALAFGLGAYVYMFSAFNVLGVEGQGLWMLYTFPRSIERTLLQKVGLWVLLGLAYCGVTLVVCAFYQPRLDAEVVSDAVLALCGVGIYAFIAAGIGVLGTDPFETEPQRKVRPEMVYLYLMLSAMFTFGIYSDSVWARLVLLTLCSGLAFALWQKVRDHAPYLLDPMEEPPPRIALADGLIAALAFFVLQGLIMLVMSKLETTLPLGTQILFAFAGAGILVALFTFNLFWRIKVPHLLAAVGFRLGPDRTGSWAGSVVWGVALGLLSAGAAALYVRTAEGFESFRAMKELAQQTQMDDSLKIWLAVLAVCAAPLCEEYIFRGLIFRGLRRSMPALLSILLSAGIFAIVHPPFSVVPVFIMGLAAGLAFERTGLLLAPILTHGVYNYIVVTHMQ